LPACDLAEQISEALLDTSEDTTVGEPFLALPGSGEPRWLLPQRHRRIDSTLAAWSPFRLRSQIKWGAVRAANQTGVLSALPNVAPVTIAGLDSFDWRAVGWKGTQNPIVAVHIGTPGMTRKAVLLLVDSTTGTCCTVVKVPLTEAAKRAILREAEVVLTLEREGHGCAPRLIYADYDRGIATQTALLGTTGRRNFAPAYESLLRSFTQKGESTSIVEHASDWQEQLLCPPCPEVDVSLLADALSELCDTSALPCCWVHGDFAPWNLKHMPDGTVALLDWENAYRGGLPLQDAFHFLHIQDYLFHRQPGAHSLEMAPVASRLGITLQQCHKLEVAFLVHFYLGRMAANESKHGKFLARTLRVVLRDGNHRSLN